MNQCYILYGWKIDVMCALKILETLDEEEYYHWHNTELAPGVYLSYNCPAPGLNFIESDFYITLGPPRVSTYDPDDLFDLLRDRNLLERGWKVCKQVCNLPHDVKMTYPDIFAVTHFY
jgi:hypothetical protein